MALQLALQAVPAQFRIWQIDNQRLSADEKGGFDDFRRECRWFLKIILLVCGLWSVVCRRCELLQTALIINLVLNQLDLEGATHHLKQPLGHFFPQTE